MEFRFSRFSPPLLFCSHFHSLESFPISILLLKIYHKIMINVTINVYIGAFGATQEKHWKSGISEVVWKLSKSHVISCTYISNEDLRKGNNSIEALVSLLKAGNSEIILYVLLSHPCQGTHVLQRDGTVWDVSKMGKLLKDGLRGFRGFPSNNNLECPVFLQDKYEYLQPLMNVGFATKTLRIYRSPDGILSEDTKREIWRSVDSWCLYLIIYTSLLLVYQLFSFCQMNFEIPWHDSSGNAIALGGWVLKPAFTTNSVGVKWCPNPRDIIDEFYILCRNKELLFVPYFMLQARASNRMVCILQYVHCSFFVFGVRTLCHSLTVY